MQPPTGIETRVERGNDQVRGIDIEPVIEPSNPASESDSGVKCLRVRDASEDPRHSVRHLCLFDE